MAISSPFLALAASIRGIASADAVSVATSDCDLAAASGDGAGCWLPDKPPASPSLSAACDSATAAVAAAANSAEVSSSCTPGLRGPQVLQTEVANEGGGKYDV
jgi:hypothetical protein